MGRSDQPNTRDQADLRATAQSYVALFEQSMDRIFLHDLDGTIVDVNRAAITQSGHSRDELLRMTVFDLQGEELSREETIRQWRAWSPAEAVLIEGTHRRKDGSVHPVEINTGKVQIGDRELILAIVRDLTERKQAEAHRRELEQQLLHAQKLEAIGRLAGGVAHDFNNMLCGILGHAELALAELRGQDPVHESLEAIVTAGNRARDLTQQLLAYSRKQVTEPKTLDLGQLITELQPMLARLLGEDIILSMATANEPWLVRVDPGQIEQVVLNLAINARDAMPDGGELLIETANVTLDRTYCARHAAATAGPCVMLAVSDTGAGMDEATRQRIFEPFFTTKELGKGTGLGLATVYGVVRQGGGWIEVYSEPGQGTAFKVYFPRVSAGAAPPLRAAPRPTAIPRGEETVLVVEDERVVLDVAVRLLERCGYQVLCATNAEGALQLAAEHDGPIHLLLTDVVMPGMNGRELAVTLGEEHRNLKVLYTSGYTENVIIQHGVLDAGLEFIAKPYTMETLAVRVRQVLDG